MAGDPLSPGERVRVRAGVLHSEGSRENGAARDGPALTPALSAGVREPRGQSRPPATSARAEDCAVANPATMKRCAQARPLHCP